MSQESDKIDSIIADHVYLAVRTKLPVGELPAVMLDRSQVTDILASATNAAHEIGMSQARAAWRENGKLREAQQRGATQFFARHLIPPKSVMLAIILLAAGAALLIDEFSRADGFVAFLALTLLAFGYWGIWSSIGQTKQ